MDFPCEYMVINTYLHYIGFMAISREQNASNIEFCRPLCMNTIRMC
jgi:hypothetical protein